MSDDELIERLWDASQRLAMQIAAMPLELRNQAYEATEEALRDTAELLGIAPEDVNTFASVQVQLIREIVAKIDLSGKPTGGHA